MTSPVRGFAPPGEPTMGFILDLGTEKAKVSPTWPASRLAIVSVPPASTTVSLLSSETGFSSTPLARGMTDLPSPRTISTYGAVVDLIEIA